LLGNVPLLLRMYDRAALGLQPVPCGRNLLDWRRYSVCFTGNVSMSTRLQYPRAILLSFFLLQACTALLWAAPAAAEWTTFLGAQFGCDGVVHAIHVNGDGRVAVGGYFTSCGGVAAGGVAIFDPASNSWSSPDGGVSGIVAGSAMVDAVLWFDGDLYVGGAFTHAGGVPAANIARWDGSSWSSLQGEAGARVYALTVHQGHLVAGGGSTTGFLSGGVARWTGSSWENLDSGVWGTAYALASSGSDLYVGGTFSSAGLLTVKNIARWDGTQWHSLGTDSANGVNLGVFAIAEWEGEIYVGGMFSQAGGAPARRIARWDGLGWSNLEEHGPIGSGGMVKELAVHDGQLVAGGFFSQPDGLPSQSLARWDGSHWTYFGDDAPDSGVEGLAVGAGVLYVGGYFRLAGGQAVDHIASLDAGQWHALGPAEVDGVNGPVYALAQVGESLYLAGGFTRADADLARGIARLQDGAFSALDGSVGTLFKSLLQVDGDLYAGGDLGELGGVVVNNIARWDGSNWHSLGVGIGNGFSADHRVNAIARFDGRLYAGGRFFQAGGQPATNLASWDGFGWTSLFVGQPGGGEEVLALAADDDYLYVGGIFASIGELHVRNIARWDGQSWSALGDGVDGPVQAMWASASSLYVCGRFSPVGVLPAISIMRWDGEQWRPLGAGIQGDCSALEASGGELYVGGSYSSAGGLPTNNLARWNGMRWQAVGSGAENGVTGRVLALLSRGGVLHVGGDISAAGGEQTVGYAQWTLPTPPVFLSSFEAPL
jgi:trimeric autotransporter adhesin